LYFKIDVRDYSATLKIKAREKILEKYSTRSLNDVECSHPMAEKDIFGVIKGIEIFLIFLAPRPFRSRTDCK